MVKIYAGWHIAQANEQARQRHFMGLVSEHSLYNLNARTVELEVIPACQAYGLGLIPYSPLAGGLLGGVEIGADGLHLLLPGDLFFDSRAWQCYSCGQSQFRQRSDRAAPFNVERREVVREKAHTRRRRRHNAAGRRVGADGVIGPAPRALTAAGG